MATSTVPDATTSTLSVICLPAEERRKILLESLRAGYPRIPKVSHPVSAKVSRYVSQFTSGRWRERIWTSDDSDAPEDEDMQCETATPETEAPRPLVIYGCDLHCEDYAKEREMINRWNIVERELHFPNLEKGYVQRRDAKTQSEVGVESRPTPTAQNVDSTQEPTTKDVSMEECQESPQKVTENFKPSTEETSSGITGLESQVQILSGNIVVVEQESLSSVQESKPLVLYTKAPGEIETSPLQESADTNLVSNSESSGPLEGKESFEEKVSTAPGDSKALGSSGTEMKTFETTPHAESSVGQTVASNSEASVILKIKESDDVKEVAAVHDSKVSKIETSETTSTGPESGNKVSVPNSESSTVLEEMESADKMETTAVLEDSEEASTEKDMETSETTSTAVSSGVKSSANNSNTSTVLEVKESENKTEAATIPEHSNVAGTSETDMETSGTTLRVKRKADSSSVDDPDEKRTKKTYVEK